MGDQLEHGIAVSSDSTSEQGPVVNCHDLPCTILHTTV